MVGVAVERHFRCTCWLAIYPAAGPAGLDAAGLFTGVLVGSATAAVVMAMRRSGNAKRLRIPLTTLIIGGTVAIALQSSSPPSPPTRASSIRPQPGWPSSKSLATGPGR